MVTIELIDDYFVEVDALNHTLKQRFEGKDKDGNVKQSVRTIGYYSKLPDCIEKMARLITLAEFEGQIISIQEYAQKAEKSFQKCLMIKL